MAGLNGIRKLPDTWQPTDQEIRDYLTKGYGDPTSPMSRFIDNLDEAKLSAIIAEEPA